jgi:hypothetical protein
VVVVPNGWTVDSRFSIVGIALWGNYVVGECRDLNSDASLGFFILKTDLWGLKEGLSKPQWKIDLAARGIPSDIELHDPQHFAVEK